MEVLTLLSEMESNITHNIMRVTCRPLVVGDLKHVSKFLVRNLGDPISICKKTDRLRKVISCNLNANVNRKSDKSIVLKKLSNEGEYARGDNGGKALG